MEQVNFFQLIKNVENYAKTNNYYEFLKYLVIQLHPKTIVELGTHRGHSCVAMLTGFRNYNGHIYTIDIREQFPLEDHRITKIISNDLEVDLEQIPKIDLLFIDTHHYANHIAKELNKYIPHVKMNGIVVMDDILINDMYSVWKKIKYPKIELNHIHNSGFGVFVKDSKWVNRSFGTLLKKDLPAT